jgi:2-keto-4-pentenoate hydratase
MLIAASLALAGCISAREQASRALFNAAQAGEALPLAHRIDETLTIESAYRIQRSFVARKLADARPAGFKAGLTSPAAQARFRASGPIAGVLPLDPEHTPATLSLRELRGLNIETEVALRVGTPIRKRLASAAEARAVIDGVAPAIELPDLDYQTPADLSALDIIASNVAAAYFIVGQFVPPAQRDPNAVAPTLSCDGKELNRGQASDALGDQWQAALWLINTMVDQGWRIEPGQILLTGALGRMVPAQRGHCVASYGDWGTLQIAIVD